MIAEAVTVQQVVLYEGPGAESLPPDQRQALTRGLLERGFTVRVHRSDAPVDLPAGRQMVVVGQFNGQPPEALASSASGPSVHLHDITGISAADAVQQVTEQCSQPAHAVVHDWKPWFPVIDYDRCTNCMQCLSFCLFDVYGVTKDGQITVQNESNCKTDCPACSRVCPEVAILFPKYKAGPINGDVVSEDDVRREAMKVDISALLGGDVYAMLRDRSIKAKSRFSRERDDERALKERQRCLKKLQGAGDAEVPAEVLASLPSIDEIQQKAADAKRRADEALAANGRRQPTDSPDA